VSFEGAGVYYAATETETKLCRNQDIVIVGAGNSAGQAIVALSRYARRVHVIARTRDLGKSMSRYLVDRVEHIDNVLIHRGAVGDGVGRRQSSPGHPHPRRCWRRDAPQHAALFCSSGPIRTRMAEWLRAA